MTPGPSSARSSGGRGVGIASASAAASNGSKAGAAAKRARGIPSGRGAAASKLVQRKGADEGLTASDVQLDEAAGPQDIDQSGPEHGDGIARPAKDDGTSPGSTVSDKV